MARHARVSIWKSLIVAAAAASPLTLTACGLFVGSVEGDRVFDAGRDGGRDSADEEDGGHDGPRESGADRVADSPVSE